MAPGSSIPAWRIPWTEEPGGLQSMGSQRVGHDWAHHWTVIGAQWMIVRWNNKWIKENEENKWNCTVMLRARISEPTEREQVHHGNARARREFISSALGPKSHLTQGNPTRAPNKGVWRRIYRQFFVSVTGVAGITWLARQDERISCHFLVNMTQVLEPGFWSLTVPSLADGRWIPSTFISSIISIICWPFPN